MLYQLHAPQNTEGTGGLMAFTNSEAVAVQWQREGGLVKLDMTEVPSR